MTWLLLFPCLSHPTCSLQPHYQFQVALNTCQYVDLCHLTVCLTNTLNQVAQSSTPSTCAMRTRKQAQSEPPRGEARDARQRQEDEVARNNQSSSPSIDLQVQARQFKVQKLKLRSGPRAASTAQKRVSFTPKEQDLLREHDLDDEDSRIAQGLLRQRNLDEENFLSAQDLSKIPEPASHQEKRRRSRRISEAAEQRHREDSVVSNQSILRNANQQAKQRIPTKLRVTYNADVRKKASSNVRRTRQASRAAQEAEQHRREQSAISNQAIIRQARERTKKASRAKRRVRAASTPFTARVISYTTDRRKTRSQARREAEEAEAARQRRRAKAAGLRRHSERLRIQQEEQEEQEDVEEDEEEEEEEEGAVVVAAKTSLATFFDLLPELREMCYRFALNELTPRYRRLGPGIERPVWDLNTSAWPEVLRSFNINSQIRQEFLAMVYTKYIINIEMSPRDYGLGGAVEILQKSGAGQMLHRMILTFEPYAGADWSHLSFPGLGMENLKHLRIENLPCYFVIPGGERTEYALELEPFDLLKSWTDNSTFVFELLHLLTLDTFEVVWRCRHRGADIIHAAVNRVLEHEIRQRITVDDSEQDPEEEPEEEPELESGPPTPTTPGDWEELQPRREIDEEEADEDEEMSRESNDEDEDMDESDDSEDYIDREIVFGERYDVEPHDEVMEGNDIGDVDDWDEDIE